MIKKISEFFVVIPSDFNFLAQLDFFQSRYGKNGRFWHLNPNIKTENFSQISNLIQAGEQYLIEQHQISGSASYWQANNFVKDKEGINISPQIGSLLWELSEQQLIEGESKTKKLFPTKSCSVFILDRGLWIDENYQWYSYLQCHPDGAFWFDLKSTIQPIENKTYLPFLRKIK